MKRTIFCQIAILFVLFAGCKSSNKHTDDLSDSPLEEEQGQIVSEFSSPDRPIFAPNGFLYFIGDSGLSINVMDLTDYTVSEFVSLPFEAEFLKITDDQESLYVSETITSAEVGDGKQKIIRVSLATGTIDPNFVSIEDDVAITSFFPRNNGDVIVAGGGRPRQSFTPGPLIYTNLYTGLIIDKVDSVATNQFIIPNGDGPMFANSILGGRFNYIDYYSIDGGTFSITLETSYILGTTPTPFFDSSGGRIFLSNGSILNSNDFSVASQIDGFLKAYLDYNRNMLILFKLTLGQDSFEIRNLDTLEIISTETSSIPLITQEYRACCIFADEDLYAVVKFNDSDINRLIRFNYPN